MKNNSFLRLAFLSLAILAISFTGCKKDKADDNDTTSLQQLSKDQQSVENSSDDVMNDVNDVLSNGANKSAETLTCMHITVDSTQISGDTIIYSITFNGLNCNGRLYRTGSATVKRNINTHWHQAGAKVTVTYNAVHVTRVATNKTVIINGTRSFENVSGGYLVELGSTMTSIVHKITGNLQVTFEDNTTRTWNIAKQRTFSGTPSQLQVAIEGLGTAGGFTNLAYWGTNRHGEEFYTSVLVQVVRKQSCDWDPVSGQIIHRIPGVSKTANITFGYDSQNQPVTNGNCPTKYKVDWQTANHSGTVYLDIP